MRLVNLICEQALINAFCDGETKITAKHIEHSARELQLFGQQRSHRGEPEPLSTQADAEPEL